MVMEVLESETAVTNRACERQYTYMSEFKVHAAGALVDAMHRVYLEVQRSLMKEESKVYFRYGGYGILYQYYYCYYYILYQYSVYYILYLYGVYYTSTTMLYYYCILQQYYYYAILLYMLVITINIILIFLHELILYPHILYYILYTIVTDVCVFQCSLHAVKVCISEKN